MGNMLQNILHVNSLNEYYALAGRLTSRKPISPHNP